MRVERRAAVLLSPRFFFKSLKASWLMLILLRVITSHLERLRVRPTVEQVFSMNSTSAATVSALPPRVRSSRYPKAREEPVSRRIGCSGRQNSNGVNVLLNKRRQLHNFIHAFLINCLESALYNCSL